MIYGATGHTGGLLAAEARAAGLHAVLAGRNQGRVRRQAERYGLSHRAALLDDPESLDRALEGVEVVLNAAGPFSATAGPVLDACVRRGAHYLDVTGEPRVIEALAARHAEAVDRGIMVMPAVGFDVVPTDCLALHVKRRLPGARTLRVAISHPKVMSAGSAKTLVESIGLGLVREEGEVREVPLAARARSFDLGEGPRRCLSVSLADTVTAYFTTGIPNIETYLQASPIVSLALACCRTARAALTGPPLSQALSALAGLLPAPARAAGDDPMYAVAEAEAPGGRRVAARLRTGDAYGFTALAAIAVARRALAGDVEPGFQTPARVYGSDFVLSLPDVVREDLPVAS